MKLLATVPFIPTNFTYRHVYRRAMDSRLDFSPNSVEDTFITAAAVMDVQFELATYGSETVLAITMKSNPSCESDADLPVDDVILSWDQLNIPFMQLCSEEFQRIFRKFQ